MQALDRRSISASLDKDALRLPGLTVISAPPGYGKTTAVVVWLTNAKRRSAWFGLDALRLPSPEFLASVITNEISILPFPFSLILDDYHEIQNTHVHEMIHGLIRFQPCNLHIAILTRVDPPFPLTRYRVQGRMTELRAEDLRFSEGETSRFLATFIGNPISPSAVVVLSEKTEGWPAALQLCALSLRDSSSPDLETFVTNFSGQDLYIVDYLLEEVLQRQPPEIVDFLLETSILDRFCADLCDWIRGEKGSRQHLNEIEQRNLFLIPLDSTQNWYRYHSLFSKFLYVRLSQERKQHLHLKAANWFEKKNMPGVAVNHAVQSGNVEVAGQMINDQAGGAFQRGQHALLGGWLESLSEDFIRSNFELAVYKAWVLFLTGKAEGLRLFLTRFDPDLTNTENTESYKRYLSLKAWLARSQGDGLAIDESKLLLEKNNKDDPIVNLIAHLSVGQAAFQEGRTDTAIRLLREAYEVERESSNTFAALCALHTLCFFLLDSGKREEVERLCLEALDIFTDSQGEKLPISGLAYLPLAVSCYEANAVDDAKIYSEIGLSLCRTLNLEDILVEDGTRTLALVHLAQGRLEDALLLLNDTLERYDLSALYAPLNCLQALRAEIAIRQGNLQSANSWADSRGFDGNSPPAGPPGYEHIVFIRLLLAQRHLGNASTWLSVLKRSCEQAQRSRTLLSVLLLEVHWCILCERSDQALRRTEQALMIAAPQDYRRAFIDEFPTIQPVVLKCRPVAPEFIDSLSIDRLVGSESPMPAPISGSQAEQMLEIDPLTGREQEILELAAEALSNQEIADRLYISVGTVKWPMNHILSKLNATSRNKAVSRGRDLGLL